MSRYPDLDPDCLSFADADAVEQIIIPRTNDIGGFEVRRALPSAERRMVGPFIFWDQMGPGEFLTGQGLDVRPHPHIGLSTLSYLFDGEMTHRDSLGSDIVIRPGAVNLMTAGQGITHSERTAQEIRDRKNRLFGIQSWMALPLDKEEMVPDFEHIAKDDLPTLNDDGVKLRLICGEAYGLKSPVETFWDTLYVDIQLEQGTKLPIPAEAEERALYLLEGNLTIGGQSYAPGRMLILHPKDPVIVHADTTCRLLLLGGATMDGPRHIWWNFVSSSRERIEQAKNDWQAGKFADVPNDPEYIPLPNK